MDNFEISSLKNPADTVKYDSFRYRKTLINFIQAPNSTETFDITFSNYDCIESWTLYHKAYLEISVIYTFSANDEAVKRTWLFKNTPNMVRSGELRINNSVVEDIREPGLIMGSLTMAQCSPSYLPGAKWYGFTTEVIPLNADGTATSKNETDLEGFRKDQDDLYGKAADGSATYRVKFLIPLNQLFQFHRSVYTPLMNLKLEWSLTLDPLNMFYFPDTVAKTVTSYSVPSISIHVPSVEIPPGRLPMGERAPLIWSRWRSGKYNVVDGVNVFNAGNQIVGPEKLLLIFTPKAIKPEQTFGSFRHAMDLKITNLNISMGTVNVFSSDLLDKDDFYREFKLNSKFRGDLSCDGPILNACDYKANNTIFLFDISRVAGIRRVNDTNVDVRFTSNMECGCQFFISTSKTTFYTTRGDISTA